MNEEERRKAIAQAGIAYLEAATLENKKRKRWIRIEAAAIGLLSCHDELERRCGPAPLLPSGEPADLRIRYEISAGLLKEALK